MDSLESRKCLVLERRQQVEKRFGKNPTLYSSGDDYSINLPKNIRVKLSTDLYKRILRETECDE
jgi:hypothetical protein